MVTCLRIFARVPGYIFPVVAQLLTSGQKDALAKHQDPKGNYHFYVKDPRTRESRSMRGMMGPSLSVDRIRKELFDRVNSKFRFGWLLGHVGLRFRCKPLQVWPHRLALFHGGGQGGTPHGHGHGTGDRDRGQGRGRKNVKS